MAQIVITADTKQAERALGDLQNTLKGLAGVVFGAGIAESLYKLTVQSQELTNKLLSVSDNLAGANEKFALVAATAKLTGSSIGATADLYQKLAQSSTFAGSSTTSLLGIVDRFNKTLQISGADAQSAAAATYQFAQAMSKGTLNGDEFRTITETNGYMLRILEKELGKSSTELRQMASEGKLSAEVIAAALLKSQKVAEDYNKTIRTIPQAFNNVQTSLVEVVDKLNKFTGAGDAAVKVLQWFADNQGALIGGVLGLAGAMAVLALRLAAVRALMITTGWGALIVAAGVAAGYAAQEMGLFGDETKKADEAIKNLDKDAQAGLVIHHQRTTAALDLDKALKEQVGLLKASNDLDARATPFKNIQLEVQKEIAKEAEKYKKTGEAMPKVLADQLGLETARKILNEERLKVDADILNLQDESISLGIQDLDQRGIAVQLRQLERSVSAETFALRKADYEQELRNLDLAKLKVEQANLYRLMSGQATPQTAVQRVQTVTEVVAGYDPRLKMEQDYQTKKKAINEMIALDEQQSNGVISKNHELLVAAKNNLDQQYRDQKVIADLEFANKDLLNQKALMDKRIGLEVQVATAKIEVANQEVLQRQAVGEAILSAEQKVADARMRQAGVTNSAIIDAVKQQMEQVKMIQQGGVVGFQGMLGAIDTVMVQMGSTNRKAFEAHKALAIAQAVISTYQAAAQAIAFPPGPPLSFIYVAGAIAAGFAQVNAIRSQQYSGRALGGAVSQGTPYVVGEKGPEMFIPAGSGTIVPNSELQSNGGTVNVTFQITANDTTGFDELLMKRRGLITQVIRDAQLERGQRLGA